MGVGRPPQPQGKKKGKKPTAWQRFQAKGLRAGKSMRQIGREWRSLKNSSGKAPRGAGFIAPLDSFGRQIDSLMGRRRRSRSGFKKRRVISPERRIKSAETKLWRLALKLQRAKKYVEAKKAKAAAAKAAKETAKAAKFVRFGSPEELRARLAHLQKVVNQAEAAQRRAAEAAGEKKGGWFSSIGGFGNIADEEERLKNKFGSDASRRRKKKGSKRKGSKRKWRKGKKNPFLAWQRFCRKHKGKGYSRKKLSAMYKAEKRRLASGGRKASHKAPAKRRKGQKKRKTARDFGFFF